jgi:hypothetical protein
VVSWSARRRVRDTFVVILAGLWMPGLAVWCHSLINQTKKKKEKGKNTQGERQLARCADTEPGNSSSHNSCQSLLSFIQRLRFPSSAAAAQHQHTRTHTAHNRHTKHGWILQTQSSACMPASCSANLAAQARVSCGCCGVSAAGSACLAVSRETTRKLNLKKTFTDFFSSFLLVRVALEDTADHVVGDPS